jgi:hypothetical protein
MRKLMFQIQCSRCERVETQEASAEAARAELAAPASSVADADADDGEVFYAVLVGGAAPLEIRFDELCSPCRRTIRAVLEHVGKRIEGLSPDRKAETKPRKAKEKPVEKAAAHTAQPPQSHTPNHAHSSPAKPAAPPV